MHRTAVWQYSSNSNIKIVHNSIVYFLWNPSDFFSDDVLSCLSGIPSQNSQVGWDLGNRMARIYWFDTKWVCPIESYAWGIQVFCSRNEIAPYFSNRALEYISHNFPWRRLILHQTNNPWPSYSQALNPPDYFMRGYLKERVCENNPQTREDIIRREFELLLCCHTAVRCMGRT